VIIREQYSGDGDNLLLNDKLTAVKLVRQVLRRKVYSCVTVKEEDVLKSDVSSTTIINIFRFL